MLIASSRKHIMWYKEEIEKLLPDIPRDKVPLDGAPATVYSSS